MVSVSVFCVFCLSFSLCVRVALFLNLVFIVFDFSINASSSRLSSHISANFYYWLEIVCVCVCVWYLLIQKYFLEQNDLLLTWWSSSLIISFRRQIAAHMLLFRIMRSIIHSPHHILSAFYYLRFLVISISIPIFSPFFPFLSLSRFVLLFIWFFNFCNRSLLVCCFYFLAVTTISLTKACSLQQLENE